MSRSQKKFNHSKVLSLDFSSNTQNKPLEYLNNSNSALVLSLSNNELQKDNLFNSNCNLSNHSIVISTKLRSKNKLLTFKDHFVNNITKIKQSTATMINHLRNKRTYIYPLVNKGKGNSKPTLISKKLKLNLQYNMTTKNTNQVFKPFSFIKGDEEKAKFKRKRLFQLTEEEVKKKSRKVYFIPLALLNAQNYIRDTGLQISAITDQLKLILLNVNQLNTEILFSSNFMKAFMILSNKQKTQFNSLIEETTALFVIIQPKILKRIHTSLDQILYCDIPNIKEEQSKPVASEDECLVLNLKWFKSVTTYFMACIEIFQVMKNKVTHMLFVPNEFFTIKVSLDLLRYDTNYLIVTGRHYIEKYYNDKEMISRFEEGIENIDKLDQGHYVNHAQIDNGKKSKMRILKGIKAKLNKINAALDGERTVDLPNKKTKKKLMLIKESLLNLPVVNDIFNYYDKDTREKIIAQRVCQRIMYYGEELDNDSK